MTIQIFKDDIGQLLNHLFSRWNGGSGFVGSGFEFIYILWIIIIVWCIRQDRLIWILLTIHIHQIFQHGTAYSWFSCKAPIFHLRLHKFTKFRMQTYESSFWEKKIVYHQKTYRRSGWWDIWDIHYILEHIKMNWFFFVSIIWSCVKVWMNIVFKWLG